MDKDDIKLLALCIIACELIGILGGIFTAPSVATWYATLAKPSFQPPNWVFGPAWTTLYLLMGISLFFLLKAKNNKMALNLFAAQLFLNFLWSILFFGLRSPLLALVEIVLLWIAIAATIVAAYRVSKEAALLLTPYILWVSFASVLNYSVWALN